MIVLGIYVNLAVKTKIYLNVVFSNETVADSQKKLIAFYNIMSTHPDFESVSKEDFHEIMTRF